MTESSRSSPESTKARNFLRKFVLPPVLGFGEERKGLGPRLVYGTVPKLRKVVLDIGVFPGMVWKAGQASGGSAPRPEAKFHCQFASGLQQGYVLRNTSSVSTSQEQKHSSSFCLSPPVPKQKLSACHALKPSTTCASCPRRPEIVLDQANYSNKPEGKTPKQGSGLLLP